MARRRIVQAQLPARTGRHHGLAYTLWRPAGDPLGGVVILHGADSVKESHHDFARAAAAPGLMAVAFDARGHGESGGPMSAEVIDDVVAISRLLREELPPGAPIALRGSSMGGMLALLAARKSEAAAVVAIAPAPVSEFSRGLSRGRFAFAFEPDLPAALDGSSLADALDRLPIPVLIMHATGDERVPVVFSRELAGHLRHPMSRLLEVPGGHHRSIQHDEEMQAVSLGFLKRALCDARPEPVPRS